MTNLKTLLFTCALLFCEPAIFANDDNAGTGTVAETMTSGGYVYVRLEENDKWLASRPVPVVVGDKVTYSGGAVMKDFHSRTLDRTFEWITFVMEFEVEAQFNAEMHAAAAASGMSDFGKSTTAEEPTSGEIEPIEGGKTVAGIIDGSTGLRDQEVSLRAKVMKVSENILGKNWITLQDGTGEPGSKLLATSAELPEIGSILVVKGVVKTDVDLGMGYKYAVMLEEATFSE